MYPPAASPLPDISFACTPEELFASLERMMSGFPLPSNVITDINPYIYMPLNLPDGVWYFVSSKQNTNTRHGFWKAKGEAIEVFSNSVIIGWRIAHEFYEGQVSHEHKTDWVMQEFSITRNRVCESTKSENSSSLCRAFLSAEQTPNCENQQNMSTVDTSQDSSSNPQVQDDDGKTELAVSERPANNHVPYLPDSDYISRDDFFDPEGWLKELESNNNQDEVQDNAGYKYTASASHRPTEVVVYLATGSLIDVEIRSSPTREIHETDSSAFSRGFVDHEALRQANSGQEANYRDASPSTSSHSQNVASSSHSNSAAVRNGEEKTVGRVDKLKKYIYIMLQAILDALI